MKSPKTGNLFVVLFIVMNLAFVPWLQSCTKTNEGNIHLAEIGRHDTVGAEISAYDPATNRLFVTSTGDHVDVLDLADPANPALVKTLSFHATSAAVKNGILAIAVPDPIDDTNNGRVYLYDSASSLDTPVIVEVGALPDMLTFTPDGRYLLVANEGQRGDITDPEGSVSMIEVGRGIEEAQEQRVTFERFNDLRAELLEKGVRIFPDAASVAQDLEPEYIAVSPDGTTAWITLQENNSIAVLDIPAAAFRDIIPLGYKDHNLPDNAMDASDRDNKINIANWPVFGMYMPDGISAFEANGQTYLITANEGDLRADEEIRVKALTLDSSTFPKASTLQADSRIGRLTVSSIDGDVDGDGDFDVLYSYGARSFSVWSADGTQVFESGDDLEQITADRTPALFNANDGSRDELDNRSDSMGPEPEGVTVGVVNGVTYAFIGLERAGSGVIVYDMSDPSQPAFVEYARSDLDVSSEGLLFIPSEDSANRMPLLVISNETSGTVAVYQIEGTK